DIGALSLSFTLPGNNLRIPYVHQYSVDLERTIGRYVASIAYVGTNGRSLIRFRTPNGGPFTPFAAIPGISRPINLLLPKNRPQPLLGAITIFESSAESDYNALQASLIGRTFNGFGFQLSYTYAHALDEVSDIFDLAGSYALA